MKRCGFFLAVALSLAGLAHAGPTPFPDAKDEAAWPGKGPIRVFGWMVENRNWFWSQRAKDQDAVVFAGDSLTGNWKAEWMRAMFPGLKCANRGIGGDTSRGLLFRFQEDVLDLHPRALVLLIGANDLSAHANPADAEGNLAAILALARKQNPQLPIVLCQTAPRDARESPMKPGAQSDLNARIAKLGAGLASCVVLDLFPALGDAQGQPVPAYFAKDRLHLAGPGYAQWAGLIRPALRQFGIEVGEPAPGSITFPAPKEAARPAPAPAPATGGAKLALKQDGIAIEAGSLGTFTLSYPALIDDAQKTLHKLLEKSVAGNTAVVKYEGGAQVRLSLAGGTLKLKFVNMPADVKKYLMEMLIDPGFSKGGTWKIGDKAGVFPREKPAKPHLFQGNANTFRFADATGQALALKIPQYAYEELNDCREWNWTIFAWKFIAPLDPYNPEASIVIGGDAAGGAAPPVELKLQAKDIAVKAGSLGTFELSYPELLGGAKPRKPIEVKTAGATATVRYDGGAEVICAVAGGDLTLKISGPAEELKNFTMDMHLDIAFSKGGRWKVGHLAGEFPREKPPKPHIGQQDNARTFELHDAQGLGMQIGLPEYTFQQLTDFREWNWGIFNLKCVVPVREEQVISFRSLAAGAQAKKLVDEFGQSTLEDWPDKLKSLADLKAEAESEKAYYASLTPPTFDRYGGLPGSGAKLGLKKTGFFHVQQQGGKWWLVNPDGNAFFHLGICSFGPGEDYTYVKGREQIYAWLPELHGEFQTAFRPENGSENVSFHLANQIRKFGQPYDHETYAARMIERVKRWGFNSIGAFSRIPQEAHRAANFPYVASLPLGQWEGLPRVPGVFESFDPFEEKTRARVEENIAKSIPARADDPLLIGYFIVNEPRFDEIPKNVPALNGKHACKRRLVQLLTEKYKTIEAFNAAWGAQAQAFDELVNAGLAVKTAAAHADMQDYTGLFLDTYFALVSAAYRKHDAQHLLIGARYQPITINDEQLCRITGKYCDVISFNYYTMGIEQDLLQNIHRWSGRKPLMLSEFFWSSPRDSGLVGGREVKSQQERGLAYRNYVEQSAALGFVIGIEWFTLIDQATTGRWFSKYSG